MKIVLKGGKGSGHKGHVGRQGIVGGSLPGHPVTGASESISVSIRTQGDYGRNRMLEVLGVKDIDEEGLAAYMEGLFNYTSEGLTTEVVSIEVNTYGRIEVTGIVNDSQGRRAGNFIRQFGIDNATGERVVFHDGFELFNERTGFTGINYQKTGFGSTFFQFTEDGYIKKGFDRIDVHAGMDVGGYAWARLGFDFTNNSWMWGVDATPRSTNDELIRSLKATWKTTYPGTKVPNFKHAWEWAMLTAPAPDGSDFEFGKYNMLGTTWYGSKNIRPGSFQLKVGDLYYQAKREERRNKNEG